MIPVQEFFNGKAGIDKTPLHVGRKDHQQIRKVHAMADDRPRLPYGRGNQEGRV